jgi:hypothetical protein
MPLARLPRWRFTISHAPTAGPLRQATANKTAWPAYLCLGQLGLERQRDREALAIFSSAALFRDVGVNLNKDSPVWRHKPLLNWGFLPCFGGARLPLPVARGS